MTLRKKTITGIIWNFCEQIARKGIGVVITLLLAIFLTPADYGLVAMMAVFLAIANRFMDSGFKQALIRLEVAGRNDFNTAFYANLGLGILSYILLFLAAPVIASFYHEPRLVFIIRVAGVNIFIQAFQVVQSATLSRDLNFKLQLQASVPAGIVSGLTAVVLAYMGFGVWALIVQMLFASLFTTALLWYFQGWRPTLGFSRQSLGSMYNFGYKLFLSGLLEAIFRNVYVILIARLFSATIAGYYFFADKLKQLVISQLVDSIQTVTYPALAMLQNDDSRLKDGYRNLMSVTTFLLFPVMLLLAALAEPLFSFLLPEKWFAAATYLQLICIAGVMNPLHAINMNILKVKGRSDLFLYLEIIKKLMIVGILFISLHFGIMGILIGQIINSVLAYIPNSYFSAKLTGYSVREQMADAMPSLLLSGVIGTLIYGAVYLVHWPALAKLIIFLLTSAVMYLSGAHILKLHAYILVKKILVGRTRSGG